MSIPDRNQPQDGYSKARSGMRSFGPILIVVGGILLLIGLGDFILTGIQMMTAEPFSDDRPGLPVLFLVCGFPGALLLGIGMKLTTFGYMREVSQYAAKETAPAVTTTTTAVRAAWSDDDVPCPECSAPNEPGSKFCSSCGVSIAGTPCASCGTALDRDDRFCAECGAKAEAG